MSLHAALAAITTKNMMEKISMIRKIRKLWFKNKNKKRIVLVTTQNWKIPQITMHQLHRQRRMIRMKYIQVTKQRNKHHIIVILNIQMLLISVQLIIQAWTHKMKRKKTYKNQILRKSNMMSQPENNKQRYMKNNKKKLKPNMRNKLRTVKRQWIN